MQQNLPNIQSDVSCWAKCAKNSQRAYKICKGVKTSVRNCSIAHKWRSATRRQCFPCLYQTV